MTLSKSQLKDIGFTYNRKIHRWVIPFVNGLFYYNPKEIKYKWYQRIIIGEYANDIHLTINNAPELYTLLSIFNCKYNFSII